MKKLIFAGLLVVFLAQGAIAQSITNTKTLTYDEVARVKFSVHLIDYQTPPSFDNALGQAYYNVVKTSFSENLIIPNVDITGMTDHDREIVNQYIELLNGAMISPLTWDHLLQLEAQYMNYLDRTTHKVSIYKN
jgi:hypothetical protein